MYKKSIQMIALLLLVFSTNLMAMNITISIDNGNAYLHWPQEVNASAYIIMLSDDPYDFSQATEIEVLDTSYVCPITSTNTFFRVRAILNFISINALHKTTVLEVNDGRAYVDSEYVTLEKKINDWSIRRIFDNQEIVMTNGYMLTFDPEFRSKNELTLTSGDPSINLNNNYFEFLGNREFDYSQWATENEWNQKEVDELIMFTKEGDTLWVDSNSNLLKYKITHFANNKTCKSEFVWATYNGNIVLNYFNQYYFKNDTLYRSVFEEYHDFEVNEQNEIILNPDDYPELKHYISN